MKISFCTTCMGRLHHLKETLPKNIEANADYPDLEFLVLDYNSKDGLEQWMKQAMAPHLESGKVTYWRERSAVRWRMPHAKNIAHLLATGDIVCNLDSDNLTGARYATKMARMFSECKDLLVRHHLMGGLGGRIALRRHSFREFRGYDEALSNGWGCEDDDLKKRAADAGFRVLGLGAPGDGALEHPNTDRLRFMPQWTDLMAAHAAQGRVIRERKGAVVNPSGYAIATVFRGFSGEARQVGGPMDREGILRLSEATEGWFGREEGEALLMAAERALTGPQPRTIVEIGSYAGRSTVLLGWAADRWGARVYAIDPHDGVVSSPSGGLSTTAPTLAKLTAVLARANVRGVVEIVKKRSVDVAWDKPIDLLFIDGLHDYPNVSADYAHLAKWVRPGGLIAFHDHHPMWPGVVHLVDEKVRAGAIKRSFEQNTLLVAEKLLPIGSA